MQIQNQDAICIECREGITNPICPACLAKEMQSWEDGINTEIPREDSNGVKCLFCGRGFNICTHCYGKEVYSLVKERYPQLAESFAESFGLDEEFF